MGGREIESRSFSTLGKALREFWKQNDWHCEHAYSAVRYALRCQADAWKAFFAGRGGDPRWKSRHSPPVFTIPERVPVKDGRL